jgi:phosphoribosylformimino-5-aminoimidazole carboxamide ribotide isomerase
VDPRVVLRRFAGAGVDLVHVVDLDGAFGEEPQRELVGELACLGPGIELGGGLRAADDVRWALGAGCERVVIGSLVVRDFAAFRGIAGAFPGRVVPAVEVAGGELRIAGWREAAAMTLAELCERLRGLDCPAVLVTDVERDGTLEGPNLELAVAVAAATGLPALLSGGVRSLADLEAASRRPAISGTIVGKALYEGVFTVEEALAICRGADP